MKRKIKDFINDVRDPDNSLAVDAALIASLYYGVFCLFLR